MTTQHDAVVERIEHASDEQMMQAVLRRFEDDALVRQEISLWLTGLLDDRVMLKRYEDEPPIHCICRCDACMGCEGMDDTEHDTEHDDDDARSDD